MATTRHVQSPTTNVVFFFSFPAMPSLEAMREQGVVTGALSELTTLPRLWEQLGNESQISIDMEGFRIAPVDFWHICILLISAPTRRPQIVTLPLPASRLPHCAQATTQKQHLFKCYHLYNNSALPPLAVTYCQRMGGRTGDVFLSTGFSPLADPFLCSYKLGQGRL